MQYVHSASQGNVALRSMSQRNATRRRITARRDTPQHATSQRGAARHPVSQHHEAHEELTWQSATQRVRSASRCDATLSTSQRRATRQARPHAGCVTQHVAAQRHETSTATRRLYYAARRCETSQHVMAQRHMASKAKRHNLSRFIHGRM